MPFFLIYEEKIVKLIETDKYVSIATDLFGNRFPVATKHLKMMPSCKNEVCSDLHYCNCQNIENKSCISYFCFDYKKLESAAVL